MENACKFDPNDWYTINCKDGKELLSIEEFQKY